MRNALPILNDYVVTIDNAGSLGELVHDEVKCPNEVVSYFTARTSLFEQLCAGALPEVITLANFTGEQAWDEYVKGIARAFTEIGLPMPKLVGSTESNFTAVQSACSITMIGQRHLQVQPKGMYWYVVGEPLVGEQVLTNLHKCAPLGWVYEQLKQGVIHYVHPVGSGGLQKEFERLFTSRVNVSLPVDVSGGPSTCVIVASDAPHLEGFETITKIEFAV